MLGHLQTQWWPFFSTAILPHTSHRVNWESHDWLCVLNLTDQSRCVDLHHLPFGSVKSAISTLTLGVWVLCLYDWCYSSALQLQIPCVLSHCQKTAKHIVKFVTNNMLSGNIYIFLIFYDQIAFCKMAADIWQQYFNCLTRFGRWNHDTRSEH